MSAGDAIVVLEAMKMETQVTAHRAGTVTGIRAGDHRLSPSGLPGLTRKARQEECAALVTMGGVDSTAVARGVSLRDSDSLQSSTGLPVAF
ncbi:UNVERIFIED_ORG: hypothetical protein ABIB19_003603 [Arthrobacter sp. UYEF10]